MMSIEQRLLAPEITSLRLVGRITAGHHMQELARKIDDLMQSGAQRVVFDLSAAEHLDSTGLGLIVMYGNNLRRTGGQMRIAGACGPVANTLKLGKVADVIPVFATVEQAAASLGISPGAAG